MKVLELSSGAAAGYAGMLLSQLQFDVHRLNLSDEATGSDPFLHRDKIDLDSLPDIGAYDAIVEDVGSTRLRALGVDVEALRSTMPELIIVSLSPYGMTGPYKDWVATELTIQAVGGVLHVSGYDGEAPVKLPGETAAMICGLHGATAVVTTMFGVLQGEETGAHIDISAQDTLMQHWCRHLAQYAYGGMLTRRGDRDPKGIHNNHTAMAQDGWLYLLALSIPWQDIAAFIGLGEFIDLSEETRQPWEQMQAPFHELIATRPRYDWFTDAAAMGLTFAPVEDPFQVMASPQSTARQFFEERSIGGQTVRMPGLPFRIDHGGPLND